MAHPYFQMRAVTIFELSLVCIGHVRSIPVEFFSHMQLVWMDNSMEDATWI